MVPNLTTRGLPGHNSGAQGYRTNLDLVDECDSFPYVDFAALPSTTPTKPNEEQYYAFRLPNDPRPHGFLASSVVRQMPWTADFAISPPNQVPRTVQLLDSSNGRSTTASCNASLATLIRAAVDKGVFAKTLGRKAEGEDFCIMGAPHYETAAAASSAALPSRVQLRRSAGPLFGIANRGAHMTAYTRDPATGSYQIWVPRRSAHLATYPGMLDNTVAGGVRAEETPFQCILHEADEEASLPEAFVRQYIKPVGTLTYVTQTGSNGGVDTQIAVGGFDVGLCVPDVIYCYDLEIPAGQVKRMVPAPQDDEVEAFYLWDVEKVQEAMARGDFKPNTALVLLDFFIRHGILTELNEPNYVEIISRLHRRLPVPTAPLLRQAQTESIIC